MHTLHAQIAWDQSYQNIKAGVKEKTILITDRDLYLSGELLCFKAFNIINDSISNADLSKIIYIELFNAQKSFVKEKFELINSGANGLLNIPPEIPSGYYFLRAYTNYQRNQKAESFFTKSIQIINPDLILPAVEISAEKNILTSVYSGNQDSDSLVNMAYYIHPFLISQSEEISIVNSMDKPILELSPPENGLGEIAFVPKSGDDYRLCLKFKDGRTYKKHLEFNKIQPFIIKKFETDHILRINIGATGQYPFSDSDTLRIIIKSPSFITLGASEFVLHSGMASVQIAQNIFENGINYIIIRDRNDSTLMNRPIFKNKNPTVELTIEPDKKTYATREKIDLEINTLDSNSIDLNLAVVKKGSIFGKQNLPPEIIANPYLLNSWIIFNDRVSVLEPQIELLMHLFENMLDKPAYKYLFEEDKSNHLFWLPETRGLSLSGFLRNKSSKTISQNVHLMASVLGIENQIHFTNTLKDGSFLFSLNHLRGNHSLALSIDDYQAGDLEVLINNDFAGLPLMNEIPLWLRPEDFNLIRELYFNQQSELAFDQVKIIEQEQKLSAVQSWIPDTNIYLKDYIRSESMEQMIDEIIPFVNARSIDGTYSIVIQDKEVLTTYSSPLILLDNYPVNNVNELLKLNPNLFEKVSLGYSPYQSGEKRMNGIISFYTKTDNFAGYPTDSSAVFLNFKAIRNSDQLLFPTHENKKETKEADFRNLLFWEPGLKTPEGHTITFYASDHSSFYDIIIRGVGKKGEYIFGKASLKIEDK